MASSDRPRLVEDATGRKKLKISLPGGRYQLSLDDRGVNLLFDRLGYGLRDTVPDTVVKLLIATGDAWFPHQRDYKQVIADLPQTQPLCDTERDHLVDFLRSTRIAEARIETVRDVVTTSSLASHLDPEEIEVDELPSVPDGIFDSVDGVTEQSSSDVGSGSTGSEPTATTATESGTDPLTVDSAVGRLAADTSVSTSQLEDKLTDLLDMEVTIDSAFEMLRRQYCGNPEPNLFDIPGVGTTRAHALYVAGYDTVEGLANSRPVDVAETPRVSTELATTIVEGARELIGLDESTPERLARQTGQSEERFTKALSQLAAGGVPPSAAEPTLRQVYGPSVAEIDGVDGMTAYYLFEAGYTTPWEITQATHEELVAIDYVGDSKAESIRTNAAQLIEA